MLKSTFRITDDRGIRRIVPHNKGAEAWAELSVAERDGLDAVRDIQWLRHLVSSRAILVFLWVVAILLGAISVKFIYAVPIAERPSAGGKVALLVMTAVAAIVAASFRTMLRRMLRKREAMLPAEVPMCAICGYRLTGVAAHADGCVVCPECGAAWRLLSTAEGG